jgi:hypothetical protein
MKKISLASFFTASPSSTQTLRHKRLAGLFLQHLLENSRRSKIYHLVQQESKARQLKKVSTGYKSPGSTSGPEFDSAWERISQDLTAFVFSVVGDDPLYVCIHRDECVCVVSVSDIWCNLKKKKSSRPRRTDIGSRGRRTHNKQASSG